MGSPYFARWAQYGLLSPYFARWAQYGLWLRLCAHCVARIRLRNRPISLSLHTGSCHPGVALRLPRAVFWRPFRALSSPSPNQQCPHRGRPFPLAKSTTPAPRASIPPRQINNARTAGALFPLAESTTPAPRALSSPSPNQQHPRRGRPFPLAKSTTPAPRASIPPRQINNTRTAGVHSPSPFMERGWPTGRG